MLWTEEPCKLDGQTKRGRGGGGGGRGGGKLGREHKQVGESQAGPELNYNLLACILFWECLRRLPTLISLFGQIFRLLLIATAQALES